MQSWRSIMGDRQSDKKQQSFIKWYDAGLRRLEDREKDPGKQGQIYEQIQGKSVPKRFRFILPSDPPHHGNVSNCISLIDEVRIMEDAHLLIECLFSLSFAHLHLLWSFISKWFIFSGTSALLRILIGISPLPFVCCLIVRTECGLIILCSLTSESSLDKAEFLRWCCERSWVWEWGKAENLG